MIIRFIRRRRTAMGAGLVLVLLVLVLFAFEGSRNMVFDFVKKLDFQALGKIFKDMWKSLGF